MKRVEGVLGKGRELYAEGRRLEAESTAFVRKLDTRAIFDIRRSATHRDPNTKGQTQGSC